MPRKPRFAPARCTFHVCNRGNDRRRIFLDDADYRAFLHLLERAKRRYPVKVFGICVMPNHFHGLFRPEEDGALSSYFHWALGRYSCEFRSQTQTVGNGHVFQQRFWSDPILDDYHFLNVLRYTENNPKEANLVTHAEDWPWSSLTLRAERNMLLDALPVSLPANWSELVNEEQPPEQPV
jgi:putative transposase